MTEIEKLPLTSLDIKAHQLERLKEIFPEAFTEGSKVDWDKLRLTIGEAVDTGKERFGMNWPGKGECFKTIQQPSIATLVPAREESVDFDTTKNLFIEGDNLEVLKLLQKSYLGKVKMIYIDPPYNTGNDFIYPDNYSESLDTYLAYTGQVDAEGKKFSTNTETDGRFHSKWMNMMYPRLFLAKNLLREDGVIYISIDDKELQNLRAICNEIFGEENFIESIIWRKKSGGGQQDKFFVTEHDYILVYAKYKDRFKLNEKVKKKSDKPFNKTDPKSGKKYKITKLAKWGSAAHKEDRPTMHFPIVTPSGEECYPIAPDGRPGRWRYGKKNLQILIEKDFVEWEEKEGFWIPYEKEYEPSADDVSILKERSIFYDLVENTEGSDELTELFGQKDIFDNPKPSDLIAHLGLLSTTNSDIILDFFAGSASTFHAIAKLNCLDGGQRKVICIQLPQITDEGSKARNAGFNLISDLSIERIKRTINSLKKEANESTLFDIDINTIDLGIKVFKLAKSNFNIWDAGVEKTPEAIQQQLQFHVDHISPEAEEEAILYELLLKSGFEVATAIEQLDIEGKKVFSIADGELLICLEKLLTHEVIKAMAERKPTRVICLDEGFQNNDQLITNAVQIMKSKGVVNFRTV